MVCTLTACADYSYDKVNPQQSLKMSETDTKLILSQKTNDVIATASGVNSLLMLYQEDSVTAKQGIQDSLIVAIDATIVKTETVEKYLEDMKPATRYETNKDNILSLCSDLKTNMNNLKVAINKNDNASLKTCATEYSNIMSLLKTASML